MATRTSVGSGLWSSVGTWDTGVPVDGDDVVIASGHVIEFDANQSAFVTGVKVTITGTLTHTTAAGSYCLFLKTGASVVGAGTWNIGTSGAPIPFASKHTVTGAAGWYVDGVSGLTMTVYGAEPTYTSIKLSADEAIGQTELSVDTDVTGDIWADGDIVRIDDINKGQESEEQIIAAGGIAAGTITVTAGLTAAKSAGAVVSLITRNIKIIAVGTDARAFYRIGSTETKLTIASGMWYGVNKTMFDSCHYAAISGGAFSGNTYGLNSCTAASISGGTFSGNGSGLNSCTSASISGGTFSGNGSGLTSCTAASISGGTFSGNGSGLNSCTAASISGGAFSENTYGLNSCTAASISGGTFSGNTYGLNSCAAASISGGTFSGNTYDIRASTGNLFGVELTSAIEHYVYSSMSHWWNSLQSDNHDAVDGAVKAWCKGGVVTSQTAIKPDGYTQACAHALESASYPAFWYKKFTVPAGQIYSIEVQLRKSTSMAYLPRVYLMASIGNPLAGATPIDTFTMTDSIDTWESDTFTVDNSAGNYDLDYALWFVGQNATGSVYSAYKLRQLNTDLTLVLENLAIVDTVVDAIKAKTDTLPASPAAVGSAMTLTSGERTAIANEVEAQIIDDTDAEKVLKAITDKIASVNPSLDDLTLAGIASAVRTELATELARIDAAISSRLATAGYTAPANANINSIKAKTDNLPASPAASGEYTSALSAIQADLDNPNQYKADVSSLATSAALATVAGYIDTEVAAIKAKTDLITTGTSLTIASAVSGSTITAHRGDTLSAALENIGTLLNNSKIWFTVKRDYDDADTAAVIQIEKTGGLLYLNGAVGTAGNGSLTINDEATGDVTIVLNASETAKLSPGNYQYDIQILRSAGTPVSTLTYGEFVVPADVTRATS